MRLPYLGVESRAAQNVHVEMRHFLAGVGSLVDYQAVAAFRDALAPSGILSRVKHCAEHGAVVGRKVGQRLDVSDGNDEQVDGCFGRDVSDDEHVVITVQEIAGYLAGRDLAEDAGLLHTVVLRCLRGSIRSS